MPHADAPPMTRAVALRAVGLGVAIVLAAVAVWLIVIADSTKSMRLGVLAGIWGALLGAYSMFGARRHLSDADEAQLRRSDVPVLSTNEIAVRSQGDVERVAEAAARRAFEERLEQMVRRELSREVADLRNEIARLRQDLLDKVGGQLRLERIETTRVIGSDLEALQHEVRQLKQASETGSLADFGLDVASVRRVVEPATVRPVERRPAEVQAPAADDGAAADQRPEPVESNGASAPPPLATGPDDAPRNGARRLRAPVPDAEPPRPAPQPAAADPFASLPRLSPFTDIDFDPVDTVAAPEPARTVDNPAPSGQPSPVAPQTPAYTGRRRKAEDDDVTGADGADTGRHSRTGGDDDAGGGRRRRHRSDDDEDDDLLSRLLSRSAER